MVTAVRHFSGAIFGLQTDSNHFKSDLTSVIGKLNKDYPGIATQVQSYQTDSFHIIRTGPDVQPAMYGEALEQTLSSSEHETLKQNPFDEDGVFKALNESKFNPTENGFVLAAEGYRASSQSASNVVTKVTLAPGVHIQQTVTGDNTGTVIGIVGPNTTVMGNVVVEPGKTLDF